MSYKLLIEYSVEIEPKYKSVIEDKDIVRGVECKLNFTVTNKGYSIFPGGEILPIDLAFNNIVKQTWFSEEKQVCPPLAIGEKKTLAIIPTIPVTDGLAWIKITIQSQDKQPIEYIRIETEKGQSMWRDCVYVVNREILLALIKISEMKH